MIRQETRERARISVIGPSVTTFSRHSSGGAGRRNPSTGWIHSTSQTSAERSRKIPFIPVCEAIASIRSAISTKSGVSVSDLT